MGQVSGGEHVVKIHRPVKMRKTARSSEIDQRRDGRDADPIEICPQGPPRGVHLALRMAVAGPLRSASVYNRLELPAGAELVTAARQNLVFASSSRRSNIRVASPALTSHRLNRSLRSYSQRSHHNLMAYSSCLTL